jgi:phage baseplate assembly protein W
VNRDSGRLLTSAQHLRQSIADILTTPIGSRVMRRDYGSLLPELIDQPFNDATRLRAYAATAMALARWEPRLRLTRVQLAHGELPGSALLDLDGVEIDTNAPLNLQVPLQLGAVL